MPKNILLIGYGAMGRSVFSALRDYRDARITCVLERPYRVAELRQQLHPIPIIGSVDELTEMPDLAVECAGHDAVMGIAPALLRRGIPVIAASVGALALPGAAQRLEDAARAGRARFIAIPGAIAGTDALAAARAGLNSVRYTGRKAPLGWLGTPAEQQVDLRNLRQSVVIFEGSARDAARLYPRNANVAALIALAGVGLDKTEVTLIADPGVTRNTHHLVARGAFGELDITVSAAPLPDNPKTSALAAMSIVRAVRNESEWMAI